MKMEELYWRVRNEPEWFVLGVLAVLLVFGGGGFYYYQQSTSQAKALDEFNSAFYFYTQATRSGQYNPAINRLNQVFSKYPDSQVADKALFFLGKSHYAAEDYLNAMKRFQRLVEQYPESTFVPGARLYLAYSASARENHTTAITYLNQVLQERSSGPYWNEALWQKALIQLELEEKDAALKTLQVLIDRENNEDSYWRVRAANLKAILST